MPGAPASGNTRRQLFVQGAAEAPWECLWKTAPLLRRCPLPSSSRSTFLGSRSPSRRSGSYTRKAKTNKSEHLDFLQDLEAAGLHPAKQMRSVAQHCRIPNHRIGGPSGARMSPLKALTVPLKGFNMTVPIRGRAYSHLAMWVGLCLVLVFWCAHILNAHLLSSITEARGRAPQPPFLVNGLELTLNRCLDPPFAPESRRGWYLLIVVSDSCRFSHHEVPTWTSLMRDLPFSSDDTVIIVSTHGDQLARQLDRVASTRPVRHAVLRVTDILAFGLSTGLQGTPRTVILDNTRRVRLVTERVTPTVADLIRVFARQHSNAF